MLVWRGCTDSRMPSHELTLARLPSSLCVSRNKMQCNTDSSSTGIAEKSVDNAGLEATANFTNSPSLSEQRTALASIHCNVQIKRQKGDPQAKDDSAIANARPACVRTPSRLTDTGRHPILHKARTMQARSLEHVSAKHSISCHWHSFQEHRRCLSTVHT